MYFTHLPQRGLIRVSGPDRLPFLQGLVSNDVLSLAKKGIVYAALLSPQGKFLHDFFLIDEGDTLLIDGEKVRLADLLRRLTLYRLHANVAFEPLSDEFSIVTLWDIPAATTLPAPPSSTLVNTDPRLTALGWRASGNIVTIRNWCTANGMQETTPDAYDKLRLELGVPDGSRDLTIDKSLILPFGFEPLHGVDFVKGCYVGQEVTARSKHLGQQRKHLYTIRLISGTLPLSGTAIMHTDKNVGTLCSHSDGRGLALIATEASTDNSDTFTCGDATIAATLPEWAQSQYRRNSN